MYNAAASKIRVFIYIMNPYLLFTFRHRVYSIGVSSHSKSRPTARVYGNTVSTNATLCISVCARLYELTVDSLISGITGRNDSHAFAFCSVSEWRYNIGVWSHRKAADSVMCTNTALFTFSASGNTLVLSFRSIIIRYVAFFIGTTTIVFFSSSSLGMDYDVQYWCIVT